MSLYSFLHPQIPQQKHGCLCATASCMADTAQLGSGHLEKLNLRLWYSRSSQKGLAESIFHSLATTLKAPMENCPSGIKARYSPDPEDVGQL